MISWQELAGLRSRSYYRDLRSFASSTQIVQISVPLPPLRFNSVITSEPMNFDLDKSIEILSRTPDTITTLLQGLSGDWLMNNEGPDTWSPYAVVGHLIHGEKTDWVPRAKIILSNAANKTFVPFDRFAQLHEDQDRPLEELLSEFKELRAKRLAELKALQVDDHKLAEKGMHPELGEVSLKELLSAWVVHDLGHIAQIARVMAKQYKAEVGPWTAYLSILGK